MSEDINKSVLEGTVASDIKEFTTDSGTKVQFRVLTKREWNGREFKSYNTVEAWGKVGEATRGLGLREGDRVHVEGELRTTSFTGGDGVKKWFTSVNARSVERASTPDDDVDSFPPPPPAGSDDDGLPF